VDGLPLSELRLLQGWLEPFCAARGSAWLITWMGNLEEIPKVSRVVPGESCASCHTATLAGYVIEGFHVSLLRAIHSCFRPGGFRRWRHRLCRECPSVPGWSQALRSESYTVLLLTRGTDRLPAFFHAEALQMAEWISHFWAPLLSLASRQGPPLVAARALAWERAAPWPSGPSVGSAQRRAAGDGSGGGGNGRRRHWQCPTARPLTYNACARFRLLEA